MKELAQRYLAARPHVAGETIQFGWFIFKILAPGNPPRLASLDFREMASFTEDFSEAERIAALQTATLKQFHATECPSTLIQFALVSRSYQPGGKGAFLQRQEPQNPNDSGWYLGIFDDPLDMNEEKSFVHRSLYELTIRDPRMAAYWLLPRGTTVALETGKVQFPST